MATSDDRSYWEQEARTREEEVATDQAIAQSAEGIRHAIFRATNLPANEQNPARIAALRVRLAEVEARNAAAFADDFAAEWTREVTVSRRQAWNEAVRALPKGRGPAAIIARLGFRPEDLKRAVALHNL